MKKYKACYAKQYQDSQGQNKTSWKAVGYANEVVSQQDGKVTIHLSLDSIPTGNWDGEIKLFLQDEQQNNQQQNQGYNQQQGQQNQGYQQQPPTYEYQNAQGQQVPPPNNG